MNRGSSVHRSTERPSSLSATSNPFSTRFIRPEATTYLFPPNESAQRCVDRLAEAGWRGQIVGPHGSGKSTLLATIKPALAERGRTVEMYELHDGQRCLPSAADPGRWTSASQIIVDGYEQLSAWSRWQLQRYCRRAQAGLLITCHARRPGFPILLQTSTDPSLLQQLADRLVADLPAQLRPSPAHVRRAFADQQGNLREALLQLYDVWETSCRARRDR
jgi:hypothetical protein